MLFSLKVALERRSGPRSIRSTKQGFQSFWAIVLRALTLVAALCSALLKGWFEDVITSHYWQKWKSFSIRQIELVSGSYLQFLFSHCLVLSIHTLVYFLDIQILILNNVSLCSNLSCHPSPLGVLRKKRNKDIISSGNFFLSFDFCSPNVTCYSFLWFQFPDTWA